MGLVVVAAVLQYVPTELVGSISGLKHGGIKRMLNTLCKFKLVHHETRGYDGYKLTSLGYDFLAMRAFVQQGVLTGVGQKIGVGKESDIFMVCDGEGKPCVLKLHRLGRVSFRSIKRNRDYHKSRKNASWLYLARLAALKEYTYMKVLHENGFPTPVPKAVNRHCIVMGLVDGSPLCQVKHMHDPGSVYANLMALICRFAEYGLIHCDFNEFNLLISETAQVTVIDFPQMVSTSHLNAAEYFQRDVDCIRRYFLKRYKFESDAFPVLERDVTRSRSLDVQVAASGFTPELEAELQTMLTDMHVVVGDNANALVAEGACEGDDDEHSYSSAGEPEPDGDIAGADSAELGLQHAAGAAPTLDPSPAPAFAALVLRTDAVVADDDGAGLEAPDDEACGEGESGESDDPRYGAAAAAAAAQRREERARRKQQQAAAATPVDSAFARKRLRRQMRQRLAHKKRNRTKDRTAIESRRAAVDHD